MRILNLTIAVALALTGAIVGGALGALFDGGLEAIFIDSAQVSLLGYQLIAGAVVGGLLGFTSLSVFFVATSASRLDSQSTALGVSRLTILWGSLMAVALIAEAREHTPVVTVELFRQMAGLFAVTAGASLGQFGALKFRRLPETN